MYMLQKDQLIVGTIITMNGHSKIISMIWDLLIAPLVRIHLSLMSEQFYRVFLKLKNIFVEVDITSLSRFQ